ncbi:MAG: M48 family metallopeptidase [Proteobacteria bacterium]|nr:M48 family metallopeptidase [Pseudomonadota bacterium]
MNSTITFDSPTDRKITFPLIYKNESNLFRLCFAFSCLAWATLVLFTLGLALFYVFLGVIVYLFAQSAFISYIRGTGAKISTSQFPELHKLVIQTTQKLGLSEVPEVYLLHGHGIFNAFATRFLGRNFVVLYSDIVDALKDNPNAVKFYIGHEIGHIHREHLKWMGFLLPSRLVPFLYSAYSRAREYTCDRYGFHSCDQSNDAIHALAVLSVGAHYGNQMNVDAYIEQVAYTPGFFMSFHEYLSSYPWLVKRVAALKSLSQAQEYRSPSRHPLALVMAAINGSTFIILMMIMFLFVGIIASQGSIKDLIKKIGSSVDTSLAPQTGNNGKIQQSQSDSISETEQLLMEAIASVSGAKESVEIYAKAAKKWPKTNLEAKVKETSATYDKSIQLVRVNDGYLNIFFTEESGLQNAVITLMSEFDEENPQIVYWNCAAKGIEVSDLPSGCIELNEGNDEGKTPTDSNDKTESEADGQGD